MPAPSVVAPVCATTRARVSFGLCSCSCFPWGVPEGERTSYLFCPLFVFVGAAWLVASLLRSGSPAHCRANRLLVCPHALEQTRSRQGQERLCRIRRRRSDLIRRSSCPP